MALEREIFCLDNGVFLVLLLPEQVPSLRAPRPGLAGRSCPVPGDRGARGPAALRGVVRQDGAGGGRAHRHPADQAVRQHSPEDRHRLGEMLHVV